MTSVPSSAEFVPLAGDFWKVNAESGINRTALRDDPNSREGRMPLAGKGVQEKGTAAIVPASAHSGPERDPCEKADLLDRIQRRAWYTRIAQSWSYLARWNR
jgi:hypothetical protein